MKKIKKSLAVLSLLFAASTAIFYSCTKDSNETEINNSHVQRNFEAGSIIGQNSHGTYTITVDPASLLADLNEHWRDEG